MKIVQFRLYSHDIPSFRLFYWAISCISRSFLRIFTHKTQPMESFVCKNITAEYLRQSNRFMCLNGFGTLLFMCGKGKIACGNMVYGIEGHMLFVSTPYTSFYFETCSDDVEGLLFEADVKTTLTLLSDIPAEKRIAISQRPCVRITEQQEEVIRELSRLIKEKMEETTQTADSESLNRKMCMLLRQTLCLQILQVYFDSTQVTGTPAKRENQVFGLFINAVYSNCRTQRTVTFYARLQNMSTGRFSAIIKEVSGRSPMYWIELFTLTEMRRLLSDASVSIKEIADQMNFPDQSTFGRYFKAREGMSPSAYRASRDL